MGIEKKSNEILNEIRKIYHEKFVPEDEIFSHIHRGDRIFIDTDCGEPQYLVQALIRIYCSGFQP